MKRKKHFSGLDIDVIVSVKKHVKARVKNARNGGICITTYEPLAKGKLLTLQISLPGNQKLHIKGKVMWSLEIGVKFYENGIDFFNINKNQLEMYGKCFN